LTKVWDVHSGKVTLELAGAIAGVFSPDGKWLATVGLGNNTVRVWNAASGQEVFSLKGHDHVVDSVAFSPDGERLVSASQDKTIKTWDTQSGQETLTLKGHSSHIWSVAFSPEGRRLASASSDRTVRIWDAGPEFAERAVHGIERAKSAEPGSAVSEIQEAKSGEPESAVTVIEEAKSGEPESAVTEIDGIYAVMKITDADVVGGPHAPGDHVAVQYQLKNTSDSKLIVPAHGHTDRVRFAIGNIQHWIERQGDESEIPAIPANVFRDGSRYAAGGGKVLASSQTIQAGASLMFEEHIDTSGYPPGKYIYYIEYRTLQDDVIQTAKLVVELASPSRVK
jgi:WD40 repeat protein